MLEINAKIDGFTYVDFKRSRIRSAMSLLGRGVKKEAISLISTKRVSRPGEYPGVVTGNLKRSIVYQVSKPGFMVAIHPGTTELRRKNDHWYAAYLNYGSKKTNLAPRKNYMVDALERRRQVALSVLQKALWDALEPRK